jgi:hypothetical protein
MKLLFSPFYWFSFQSLNRKKKRKEFWRMLQRLPLLFFCRRKPFFLQTGKPFFDAADVRSKPNFRPGIAVLKYGFGWSELGIGQVFLGYFRKMKMDVVSNIELATLVKERKKNFSTSRLDEINLYNQKLGDEAILHLFKVLKENQTKNITLLNLGC